jgi:hypothetical protein
MLLVCDVAGFGVRPLHCYWSYWFVVLLTMLLVYGVVGPTYHVPKYPPKPFPLCYCCSFAFLVAIPTVLHMFWWSITPIVITLQVGHWWSIMLMFASCYQVPTIAISPFCWWCYCCFVTLLILLLVCYVARAMVIWVKAHYTIHKMLSQSNFCKILKFALGHVIK